MNDLELGKKNLVTCETNIGIRLGKKQLLVALRFCKMHLHVYYPLYILKVLETQHIEKV